MFKRKKKFPYITVWGHYVMMEEVYVDSIRSAAESDPLAPPDALFYNDADRAWVTFSEQPDLMKLGLEAVAEAENIKLPHQEAK